MHLYENRAAVVQVELDQLSHLVSRLGAALFHLSMATRLSGKLVVNCILGTGWLATLAGVWRTKGCSGSNGPRGAGPWISLHYQRGKSRRANGRWPL